MFPQFVREFLKDAFSKEPWDVSDIFLNNVFGGSPYNIGIVYDRLAIQAEGVSLLDNTHKKSSEKMRDAEPPENKTISSYRDLAMTRYGEKIVNDIFNNVYRDKMYEKYFSVETGDIIVDIGAHVGAFSLSLLDRDFKKCYCVEPDAVNFKDLQENISRYGNSEKFKLINYAISETSGHGSFIIHDDMGLADKSEEGTGEVIPTLSFMDFIKNNDIDKIDFLKLDCEGAEYCILGGEENLNFIKNHVRKIAGELHLLRSSKTQQDCLNLIRDLRSVGFKVMIDNVKGVDITDIFEERVNKYREVNFYAEKQVKETNGNSSIDNLLSLYGDTSGRVDRKIDTIGLALPDNIGNLDYLLDELFNREVYTHEECRIKEGDIVVDIGANVGLFSRYAASKGAKKIYAFEPNPDNFGYLQSNKSDICESFIMAVTDREGTVDLFIDSYCGGHSIYEDNNINDSRTGKSISVFCSSIDKLIENGQLDRIDFLKVDTEGAEYEIFNGISDENLLKIDRIAIEFHNSTLKNKCSLNEFLKRFTPNFFFYVLTYSDPHMCQLYFWNKSNYGGPEVKAVYNFVNSPFAEIQKTKYDDKKYLAEFLDEDEVVYSALIGENNWVRCARKWYTDWLIRISDKNRVVTEHKFDLENKKVLISLDSKSLGDTLAWFPYVEEFRKKHKCQVVCSTFWNKLFVKEYPEIVFIPPGTVVNGLYASYNVGWFNPIDTNKNPIDYRTIPLQRAASDILGLEYKEIKPTISIPSKESSIKGKYVCLAIHSTAQAKYWNYPNGWQEIVDFLKEKGYEVVLISKEKDGYMGNVFPKGVIDKTGDRSIEDRIVDLKHADMLISIGSGISWLSWAVGTPVVLISGFSAPWCEFKTGIERIHNSNVCNSCFNDPSIEFDKGDWNWCPRKKDFECTKSITPEMVIKSIDKLIKKKYP
jgi:autotransporter strand-loop-strand O-heptosyltransferase